MKKVILFLLTLMCVLPAAFAIDIQNLTHAFPFDDNNVNDAVGAITGAATSTSNVTGKIVDAQYFGANGYVTMSGFPTTSSTENVTVSYWVNYTSGYNPQYDKAIYVDGSVGRWEVHNQNTGSYNLCIEANDGSWRVACTAAPLSANVWHHVVAQIEPGNAIRIFVDGVSITNTSFGTMVTSGANYKDIGGYSGSPGTYKLEGKLDDVNFFNRILSTAEIKAIYDNRCTYENMSICASATPNVTTADQAILIPSSPTTLQPLSVKIECESNISTIDYSLQWVRDSVNYGQEINGTVANGTLTTVYTLPAGNTTTGEQWEFDLWCSNGADVGTRTSNTVTIQPSAAETLRDKTVAFWTNGSIVDITGNGWNLNVPSVGEYKNVSNAIPGVANATYINGTVEDAYFFQPTILDTIPTAWTAVTYYIIATFYDIDAHPSGEWGFMTKSNQNFADRFYFELNRTGSDGRAYPLAFYEENNHGTSYLFSNTTIQENSTYILILEWSESNGMSIWINGTKTAYDPTETVIMADGSHIDLHLCGEGSATNGWNMTCHAMGIFNETLTEGELDFIHNNGNWNISTTIYPFNATYNPASNSSNTTNTTNASINLLLNLTHGYPMENSSIDVLGTLNGTNINNPQNISGYIGNGYNFTNGNNNKISFGGNPLINSFYPYTIAFAFDASEVPSNQIMDKIFSQDTTGGRIDIGVDSGLLIFEQNINTAWRNVTYPITANSGWHHGVVVWDRGVRFRLYVDGVNVDNLTYSGTLYSNGTGGSAIGGHYNIDTTYDFHGGVDEVYTWARNLSHQEIQTLYNNGCSYVNFSTCASGPALQNNTITINIYNATNAQKILNTVTINIMGGSYSAENTTTTGTFIYTNMTPAIYTLEISSAGFASANYYVTLASGSTQTLNAYLLEDTDSEVVFTIVDFDTGEKLENATMSIYTDVAGTPTLINVLTSDITGRALFEYTEGEEYDFIVSRTGYSDKSFSLDPIIFESYSVRIKKLVQQEYTSDYSGVNIFKTPTEVYNNQVNWFNYTFISNIGMLNTYGINVTYNGTSYVNISNNAYGSIVRVSLNITNANDQSQVTVKYFYTLANYSQKNYVDVFTIDNPTGFLGTAFFNKDNPYGLSIFDRIFIIVLLAAILGGLAYVYAGTIGSAISVVIIMGYFAYIQFVPSWSVIMSIIALLGVLTWWSSR